MKPFTIQKIKDSIYLIKEAFYKEQANIYLFTNKKHCLLIDCGLGFYDLRKFLMEKGCQDFTIAITHSHFDHAGGVNHFKEDKILVSEEQKYNLDNNKNLGLNYLKVEDFNNTNKTKSISFCNNFHIEQNSFSLYNKNTIDFFDHRLKIIKTPGHTGDSLCFYEEKRKILLTGDTLYDGKPYCNFQNSSAHKLKKSIDNLLNYRTELALAGHNQILDRSKMSKVVQKWDFALQAQSLKTNKS